MTDHYRIVIIADPHIGADRRPWLRKIGVTPKQYDAPLLEVMQWTRENDVDLLIVAGDLFDERRPTPLDYIRGQFPPDIDVLLVPGNHDLPAISAGADTHWSYAGLNPTVVRGRPALVEGNVLGLQIVCLPWPRPSDWDFDENPTGWTIGAMIGATRTDVLRHLTVLVQDLDTDRPAILVGHAMVSYAPVDWGDQPWEDAPGPGLMLGKDVVLPYNALTSLPNIGGVFLGHVHDPSQPGYVGSTQPTDWGEAGQVKSFTVVDIDRCTITSDHDHGPYTEVNGRVYTERQIPYTTSLKLGRSEGTWHAEISVEEQCQGFIDGISYDGIRFEIAVPEGVDIPQAEIQTYLENYAPYVEVIVEREVKRAARVETAEPLNQMSVHDSFKIWLEERDTDPNLVDPVMAAVDGITEDN